MTAVVRRVRRHDLRSRSRTCAVALRRRCAVAPPLHPCTVALLRCCAVALTVVVLLLCCTHCRTCCAGRGIWRRHVVVASGRDTKPTLPPCHPASVLPPLSRCLATSPASCSLMSAGRRRSGSGAPSGAAEPEPLPEIAASVANNRSESAGFSWAVPTPASPDEEWEVYNTHCLECWSTSVATAPVD